MPDPIAEQALAAAGGKGNLSAWLTKAARNTLLAEEAAALAEWDRLHRNPRDQEEDEAEREYARTLELSA